MHSVVQRTALRGQSRSGRDQLAKNLGYFSIALGVAELLAPKALCNAIGVRGVEPVVRWPMAHARWRRASRSGRATIRSHGSGLAWPATSPT